MQLAVSGWLNRVKQNSDFSPAADKINLIHFSSIPWVQFTALAHARHYDYPDSVPKVSTGKIYQSDSKFLMPVSIHAHHGLVDGLHVGQLIDAIQNTLN